MDVLVKVLGSRTNQFSNGQPVFSTAQRGISGRYPLVFVLQRVGSLIDVKTLV